MLKFIAGKFVVALLLLLWVVPLIGMAPAITLLSNLPHTLLTWVILPLAMIIAWIATFATVMPLGMIRLNRYLNKKLGV